MQSFKIKKRSGTYSELLETYGLANLLNKIFNIQNSYDVDICICKNEDYSYEIKLSQPLTDKILDNISYFPLFKYIKRESGSDVSDYADFFDYPELKQWKKERQELLNQIYKDNKGVENKWEREKRIKEVEFVFEKERIIPKELDVISQIITPNNFPGFEKLYQNFFVNKQNFPLLIKEIINYYLDDINYNGKEFDKNIKSLPFNKNVTATQLYNPSQGQGVNKIKADGLNRKNFDSLWICESMKISGALSDMICQVVKVGKSYDLKIFVPEYKEVGYSYKNTLISDFKKYLKGNTPIKIDILNILLLTQKVIEHSGYSKHPWNTKDIVTGLHSVYQKDLGQNKAVVNIGFIQVPDFIEIKSEEDVEIWVGILKEQISIIGSISEMGDTTQGLLLYRDFISGSNIESFFKFSYWYAMYLSTQLSNKKYARAFSVETLNKFYINMENKLNLSEIITNKGFLAVANAIRKSTVSLQYTPKDARKYEIRYGVAQTLQNKSKTKDDLAEFVGDFIATYNAETARKTEKTGHSFRSNVREDELAEFYTLLDNASSKIMGALLASYGFALPAKVVGANDKEDNFIDNETEE